MSLKDTQCDVCGCYFFGSEPYEWHRRTTPRGEIKLCYGCDKKYAGVEDPQKEARIRYLVAELREARRVVRRARRLLQELRRLEALST